MSSVQVTVGSLEVERNGSGVASTAHGRVTPTLEAVLLASRSSEVRSRATQYARTMEAAGYGDVQSLLQGDEDDLDEMRQELEASGVPQMAAVSIRSMFSGDALSEAVQAMSVAAPAAPNTPIDGLCAHERVLTSEPSPTRVLPETSMRQVPDTPPGPGAQPVIASDNPLISPIVNASLLLPLHTYLLLLRLLPLTQLMRSPLFHRSPSPQAEQMAEAEAEAEARTCPRTRPTTCGASSNDRTTTRLGVTAIARSTAFQVMSAVGADRRRRPRFVVQPYKQPHELTYLTVVKFLQKLEEAHDQIGARKSDDLSFEELYRNSYALVLNKHGDALYECIGCFVHKYVRQCHTKNYKRMQVVAIMLRDTHMYLDRTYVVAQAKVKTYDRFERAFKARANVWARLRHAARIIGRIIVNGRRWQLGKDTIRYAPGGEGYEKCREDWVRRGGAE